MKTTFRLLFGFLIIVSFSCQSGSKENQETEKDSSIIVEEKKEIPEPKSPNYSDAGYDLLLKLAESKDGWTSEDDSFSVMKNDDVFAVKWNSADYIVGEAEEGMITLYSKEDWESVDFVMGDCYSITFITANKFELGYFDQCARLDEDAGTTTYIKTGGEKSETAILTSPQNIQEVLDRIADTYFEAYKDDDGVYKSCTVYKLSVSGEKGEDRNQNIWLDCVMDGYELEVYEAETTADVNDFIIKCKSSSNSNCLSSGKSANIHFKTIDNNRVAIIKFDTDNESKWFVNELDYQVLSDPKEPCDEEEY